MIQLKISEHAWKRTCLRWPENKFSDSENMGHYLSNHLSKKQIEQLEKDRKKDLLLKIDHHFYPIAKNLDGGFVVKSFIPCWMMNKDLNAAYTRIEELQKIIASQRGTIGEISELKTLDGFLKYHKKKISRIVINAYWRLVKKLHASSGEIAIK